jgi:hypothetical protein
VIQQPPQQQQPKKLTQAQLKKETEDFEALVDRAMKILAKHIP